MTFDAPAGDATRRASPLRALADLGDLIAEVHRRCDTTRPAGPEQHDRIARLAVAAELAGQLQELALALIEEHVKHCRTHGSSWADIGAVLGVTRQAVQQRFSGATKRYSPNR
ncbi:hypothetical protein [Streptomyces collinus]|uniref:hypothetical protein n=1 Tax=Streptomyces collinus TaxID=42684 RepID=UPI0037F2C2A1